MSEQKLEDFERRFKEIGLNLSKKAKSDVKIIKRQGKEKIDEINKEFIVKLITDYTNITQKFLYEYEFKLNSQISENISQLNREMIKLKDELFYSFLETLLQSIKIRIEANPSGYFDFIIKQLNKFVDIIKKEEFLIQLNKRDYNMFSKIKSALNLTTLTLYNEPLTEIGGFKLFNKNKTIFIDSTFEELIRLNEESIKFNFIKIFPRYIDRRKSATELIKERNLKELLEIPNEIKQYMKEHKIEMEL
ncbi:MAG: hypothetical protein ACTSRZ_00920 [Promethearchaeota archaeon]